MNRVPLEEPIDLAQFPAEDVKHYWRLRSNSWSHEDAARIALGKKFGIPAIHGCGRDFFSRKGMEDGLGEDEQQRKMYHQKAKAAGVNPNGKRYMSGLARFAGDPEAWVDEHDAPSEIKKKLSKRGWGCSGRFEVKPAEREPPPPGPAVAEDIVQKHVSKTIVQEKLKLTPSERKQLADDTRKRLAGRQKNA